MHSKYIFRIFFLLLISLFASNATLYGASIKERMASRLPAINALKEKGLVGENNAGYLEYRTSQQPSPALLEDENTDRRAVYSAIAKQEGVSEQLVGQRRAKMLRDNGPGGYWYQQANGQWGRK